MDFQVGRLALRNMSQCSPPGHKSLAATAAASGAKGCVAAVAATFDDIRGLRTMGIVICYLALFYCRVYISLYGARFDPCAAAKKGQTIIFFWLPAAARLLRSSSASPPGPKRRQLSGLAPSFPAALFLIELHECAARNVSANDAK